MRPGTRPGSPDLVGLPQEDLSLSALPHQADILACDGHWGGSASGIRGKAGRLMVTFWVLLALCPQWPSWAPLLCLGPQPGPQAGRTRRDRLGTACWSAVRLCAPGETAACPEPPTGVHPQPPDRSLHHLAAGAWGLPCTPCIGAPDPESPSETPQNGLGQPPALSLLPV